MKKRKSLNKETWIKRLDTPFEIDWGIYWKKHKQKQNMKKYICSTTKNWADEFDLPFFDIITEDEYNKFMYAKKTLLELPGSLYFGTNEGWEDDFDYLDFNFTELSEDEAKVFEKYPIEGIEPIWDNFVDQFEEDINEMSQEEFENYVNNLEESEEEWEEDCECCGYSEEGCEEEDKEFPDE